MAVGERRDPEVSMPATVRVAFLRGDGTAGDPVRAVAQFYVDGILQAEHDPSSGEVLRHAIFGAHLCPDCKINIAAALDGLATDAVRRAEFERRS